ILTSAYSQTKTDLDREGLRGSVRSVRVQSIESITIDGHTSQDKPRQMDSLNFDRSGRMVERIIYDDFGFLVGTEKYTHDAAGLLIAAELTDEKGKPQEKTIYAYFGGKLRELQTYDGQGVLVLKEIYTY